MHSLNRGLALAMLLLWWAAQALAESAGVPALPSFEELEAAGALVGQIRITPLDIFDEEDPRERNALFGLANRLHIVTRPAVIERQLLFKSGERVSARLIEETERNLLHNRNLQQVRIRPVAYRDGVVDIEVQTRDTWSFDPGFSFARAGGANSARLALEDYNLFGSGASIGLSRVSNVDRTGNEIRLSDNRVFGTTAALDFAHAADDKGGKSQSLSLIRPFFALDERWAAGLVAARADRTDPVYERGLQVGEYRSRHRTGEAFRGWSDGLRNGWTRRTSLGISYEDDEYEALPGQLATGQLPRDVTLKAPFVRFELVQDDFRKLINRNLIDRPEFFAMGFQGRLQLGRAMSGWGSTRDLWLYSGSFSSGFELPGERTLVASAAFSGRYGTDGGERQAYGAAARYYAPQGRHTLFFASLSGDIVRHPDVTTVLQLGGDNGLRGYPLRYQSGDRRLLFSAEERVYTDWYPFRMARVGAAAFIDVGRAWKGEHAVTASERVLSDVGFGLRLVSGRSAFGNVLHADIAFPLNARGEVRSAQFLLKSKASF